MSNNCLLSDLIQALPEMLDAHRPNSSGYKFLSRVAAKAIDELPLKSATANPFQLEHFGELIFPFHKMGAIDTTHLFGLDELIIYAFYLKKKHKVTRAVDLGANLGLHSLMMAHLGFQVKCFEPDPNHFKILQSNIKLNKVENLITPHQSAVSDKAGTMEFIRVVGNTTSSHLAGAKSDAYGDLEKFPVNVVEIRSAIKDAQLVKMDVEGQEAKVILATQSEDWDNCEMMLEVGTQENAELIFNHLKKLGVNGFAQKIAWNRITELKDLPTSYKDGSLFLSKQPKMQW